MRADVERPHAGRELGAADVRGEGRGPREGHGIDDVVARVAARLRQVCRPMPPRELEALVDGIVLEVARFALQWAEGGDAPATPPPSDRSGDRARLAS